MPRLTRDPNGPAPRLRVGEVIPGDARVFLSSPDGVYTELGQGVAEWAEAQHRELGVVNREQNLLEAINQPGDASGLTIQVSTANLPPFEAMMRMYHRMISRTGRAAAAAETEARLSRWESAVDGGVFYNDIWDYFPAIVLADHDGPHSASATHWARTGEWPDDLNEYGYPDPS